MESTPERFAFRIPIGDWSGDGHGKCKWFDASAAKPIEDVRLAYFVAKKKLPDACPESFCAGYEESKVPAKAVVALEAAGYPNVDYFKPDQHGHSEPPEHETMAEVVVWFINQGDPDIDARLNVKNDPPSLTFFGYNRKHQHIGHIGYGLFY